jgi:hypothetical protein
MACSSPNNVLFWRFQDSLKDTSRNRHCHPWEALVWALVAMVLVTAEVKAQVKVSHCHRQSRMQRQICLEAAHFA